MALRRLRSLVALSKGVFPPDITARLKDGCKQLASATNRLRDLDVYLLSQQPYCELLPASLRPGLTEMFADFRAQRQREQRTVRKWLRSEEYRRRVADLEQLLDTAERTPPSKTARGPVVQLADQVLRKRCKKTASRAQAVDASTPDAAVHELRIECKKFRYALEFFGSLFQREGIAAALSRLKRLQDTLGVFNDLCVQQSSLAGYLEDKEKSATRSLVLTAAVGGLLGALHQRQVAQRDKVAAQIARFCSLDVAGTFAPSGQLVKRAA